jgi:hypothetical protein
MTFKLLGLRLTQWLLSSAMNFYQYSRRHIVWNTRMPYKHCEDAAEDGSYSQVTEECVRYGSKYCSKKSRARISCGSVT